MQLACSRCGRVLQYDGDAPSFCSYCGQRLAKQNDEATAPFDAEAPTLPPAPGAIFTADHVPEMIGPYRLIQLLGSGGMGRVYEAEETATGRRVAVKVVAAELAGSPPTVERFRKEGQLASTISHPRCVFVLAADEDAGRPYIVMELMHGSTLRDLVEKQGPLPPAEAVAKILDVIDGLQEAHRLGVIHRDVKPSNCFLEADGRVKVGDFGLAKSLAGDSRLTRTGAFLGTPQFASPEQIRGEPLTPQTDVYSVAATLYYLLAGRGPFDSSDPAATLARIVADPAPSMRSLRPTIPAALDKAVLRGLERQRERRWRDLEEFRVALLPFVPAEGSMAGLWLRIAAYLIDWTPFLFLSLALASMTGMVINANGRTRVILAAADRHALAMASYLVPTLGLFLYFAITEGIWGCSLGKRLLGLRVYPVGKSAPPGLATGFLRSFVFIAVARLASLCAGMVEANYLPENMSNESQVANPLFVICHLLLLTTMRKRNGYRGPHEFASGTRVVRLPWRGQRRHFRQSVAGPLPLAMSKPEGMPERVGSYVVDGALRWDGDTKLLGARDPGLGRTAWIWLQPLDVPPVSAVRQQINRTTRLRWLTGGRTAEWQWDAFLAPSGCSLPELTRAEGALSWSQARPLMEEIADELTNACREGTLPDPLTVEQLWVQSSGQLQLLEAVAGKWIPAHKESGLRSDEDRALSLLAEAAVVALEGRARADGKFAPPIRSPIPEHAAALVNRLLGSRHHGLTIEQVRTELSATQDRPREVTRSWRGAHLVLLTSLLALPMLLMFAAPLVGLSMRQLFELTMRYHLARYDADLLKALQNNAARDLATASITPQLAGRLGGLAMHAADLRLQQELQEETDREHDATEAMEGAARPLAKWAFATAQLEPSLKFSTRPENIREHAKEATSPDLDFAGFGDGCLLALLLTVMFFPLLWIVCASIARGPLSLRVMGLVLVRADGRRAWRLQCGWRAFLTWMPVIGLLALSTWTDFLAWRGGIPESDYGLLYWLSWTCWVLALVLLPLYAVMAIRSPNRALHDRLAGTYVVPR
jgi:hypothetical protein